MRNVPVTTTDRSGIDEALRSLDPDATRPENVMQSVNLTLGFSGRTVLSDINVAIPAGR